MEIPCSHGGGLIAFYRWVVGVWEIVPSFDSKTGKLMGNLVSEFFSRKQEWVEGGLASGTNMIQIYAARKKEDPRDHQ